MVASTSAPTRRATSTRPSCPSTRPRPSSRASPRRSTRSSWQQLAGTYETPTGFKFQVVLKEDGSLFLVFPGQPEQQLIPYKGLQFRIKEFSDVVFEFVVENGEVKALKQRDPSGEYTFTRK